MTATLPAENELLPWTDTDFRDNPYPWYDRVRREQPVYRAADGTYLLFRHADTVQWAKDSRMSIYDPNMGPWEAFADTMLFKDPPDHTALRRHTNLWFTPKLIRRWVENTAEVVAAVLDATAPGQTIEGHLELAVKPMHITMCRILGFPEHDIAPVPESMITAMNSIVAEPHPDADAHAAAAFAYLAGRITDMLAGKRRNPGDGMADALLAAQDRGELTERQVTQTLMLFWGSGGHNPGYMGAAGLELFARRPDIFDIFRDHPSERMPIINELIRLNPPEMSFLRYTGADIEIGGVPIAAGSGIRFMLGAANRDPAVFDRPDEFDHTRPPAAKHLSFGLGPHSCPGQLISRAGMEAIFTTVAQRHRRVELAAEPVVYNTDRGRNYRSLPIRLH